MIIYQGPSRLDGTTPIVAIATMSSNNNKTGSMPQVWILRQDVAPHVAVKNGLDSSICGDCSYASGNGCYVLTFQGPLSVWKAYKNGRYSSWDPASEEALVDAAKRAGGVVRLGAYGDPAAVPLDVWQQLFIVLDLHGIRALSYTHQWRRFPELRAFCMASVDSEEERQEAKALGFRTYRVRDEEAPLLAREIVCPGSSEAGKRLNCTECKICYGAPEERDQQRADVAIIIHGSRQSQALEAQKHRLQLLQLA